MSYSRTQWTEPAPGTLMATFRRLLMRPKGLVTSDKLRCAIVYLRDQCGYDIRIIGHLPRTGRGRKAAIYRIVGRVPFHSGGHYEDYLAADLARGWRPAAPSQEATA